MKEGLAHPDASVGSTAPITEAHIIKAQTATITSTQLMRRPHQSLTQLF